MVKNTIILKLTIHGWAINPADPGKNFVKRTTLKDIRNSLRRGENICYFKTGVFVLQTGGGKEICGLINLNWITNNNNP